MEEEWQGEERREENRGEGREGLGDTILLALKMKSVAEIQGKPATSRS
jgi:hypothetical protein